MIVDRGLSILWLSRPLTILGVDTEFSAVPPADNLCNYKCVIENLLYIETRLTQFIIIVPLCFRYPERRVVVRRLDLYLRPGRRRDGFVLEEPNHLRAKEKCKSV